MNKTSIEWCDFTSNPVKLELPGGQLVNACVKVSEGCRNCYAESITRRWWPKTEGDSPGYSLPILDRGELVLVEEELRKLLTFRPKPPFKHGARPTVFPFDMSDLFGEWVPFEMLDRLFAVFALRPDADFLLLTKRPERMAEYLEHVNLARRGFWQEHCGYLADVAITSGLMTEAMVRERYVTARRMFKPTLPETPTSLGDSSLYNPGWPLPNVWLGASIEDQKTADERIPRLLKCPAAVRFISYEPALGAVDIMPHIACNDLSNDGAPANRGTIQWVICGGESGHGARPCDVAWIRSVVSQCKAAGIPCFVKQLGRYPLDYSASEWPGGVVPGSGHPRLKSSKGGDMAEWPEDLRVREYPAPREVLA